MADSKQPPAPPPPPRSPAPAPFAQDPAQLSRLEQNTINAGAQVARKILAEVKPALDQLDVIFNAVGGVKESVTQEKLDNSPMLSGLTIQELNDSFYALTVAVLGPIKTSYNQLTELASRA